MSRWSSPGDSIASELLWLPLTFQNHVFLFFCSPYNFSALTHGLYIYRCVFSSIPETIIAQRVLVVAHHTLWWGCTLRNNSFNMCDAQLIAPIVHGTKLNWTIWNPLYCAMHSTKHTSLVVSWHDTFDFFIPCYNYSQQNVCNNYTPRI